MSITLQQSANWVKTHTNYTSITVGPNNEPAVTHANMTKQVILGPPFSWAWNRNKFTFTVVAGTQDYLVSIPDFGYMEVATFQPVGGGKILQFPVIYNKEAISESSDSQQPNGLAIILNDGKGNIKFRTVGLPDQSYNVIVTYQMQAVPFIALTDKWDPIPDYYAYIFNRGLLAHSYQSQGDAQQAAQEKLAFASALIACSEGLGETEKNIFLAPYLINSSQTQASALRTQQGTQARGQS